LLAGEMFLLYEQNPDIQQPNQWVGGLSQPEFKDETRYAFLICRCLLRCA